jgi:hypothetical protein
VPSPSRTRGAGTIAAMATSTERSRRHRAHLRGDHSACRAGCLSAGDRLAADLHAERVLSAAERVLAERAGKLVDALAALDRLPYSAATARDRSRMDNQLIKVLHEIRQGDKRSRAAAPPAPPPLPFRRASSDTLAAVRQRAGERRARFDAGDDSASGLPVPADWRSTVDGRPVQPEQPPDPSRNGSGPHRGPHGPAHATWPVV